jgi:hydrogenase maturation factor
MGSVDARPVCLVYTPDAVIGDMVLTHSGYSLEVLDPARAKAALEMRAALVSSE